MHKGHSTGAQALAFKFFDWFPISRCAFLYHLDLKTIEALAFMATSGCSQILAGSQHTPGQDKQWAGLMKLKMAGEARGIMSAQSRLVAAKLFQFQAPNTDQHACLDTSASVTFWVAEAWATGGRRSASSVYGKEA